MQEHLGPPPYVPPDVRRKTLLGSVCVAAEHQPAVDAMVDALISSPNPISDVLAQTLLRQRVLEDGLAYELPDSTT